MGFPAKTSIRHISELAIEFGRFAAGSAHLEGVHLSPPEHPKHAEFAMDGRRVPFAIHYELAPSAQEVARGAASNEPRRLLVVPNLTPGLLAACRHAQLSAADLNGRLYLRAHGLLVERPALGGRRYRLGTEPRNVFVGKSARIVRALLADPGRVWRQSELVLRTGATSGLVSRVVTHLERQAMLARSGTAKRDRVYRLTARDALLDAWVRADDFARRTTTHRFHALDQDPMRLTRKLSSALADQVPQFAFTQWIAAWFRHPYTEPALISLYAQQLPGSKLLDTLDLHPVADGGRVWFHLPADEGVFREVRTVDCLPFVSDAQIYLDLQNTGLRGPEQARAFRESPVFCRA